MSKAKKTPAVTLKFNKVKLGDPLEIKRFYMPGYVLKTTCPKCGGAYERDYAHEYLSYPPVGKPFTETLYCYADTDDGGQCEHEWDVTLQLDITLRIP